MVGILVTKKSTKFRSERYIKQSEEMPKSTYILCEILSELCRKIEVVY